MKALILMILAFSLFCFAFEKGDKKVEKKDESIMGWEGRTEGGQKGRDRGSKRGEGLRHTEREMETATERGGNQAAS